MRDHEPISDDDLREMLSAESIIERDFARYELWRRGLGPRPQFSHGRAHDGLPAKHFRKFYEGKEV